MSLAAALVGALAIAASYVGSLYALVPPRIRALDRDHPAHIKWRLWAVAVSCVLAGLVSAAVLGSGGGGRSGGSRSLGDAWGVSLACNAPAVVGRCLLTVVALFTGPLLQLWFDDDDDEDDDAGASRGKGVAPASSPSLVAWLASPLRRAAAATDDVWRHTPLEALRNYVAAPLSEEWAFRCCVLPLYLRVGGLTRATSVWATAATFSAAHLHHWRALRRSGASRAIAAASIAAQAAITLVFGLLGGGLLLATGSGGGAVAAHAFCNVLGPPQVGWLLREKRGVGKAARWVVAVGYVAGIVGFVAAWRGLPLAPAGCVGSERS